MALELCPFLLMSRPDEKAKCRKEDCKMFHTTAGAEEGVGLCGISNIAIRLNLIYDLLFERK